MTQQIIPPSKEVEEAIKDWATSTLPPGAAESTMPPTPIDNSLRIDIEAWAKPEKT